MSNPMDSDTLSSTLAGNDAEGGGDVGAALDWGGSFGATAETLSNDSSFASSATRSFCDGGSSADRSSAGTASIPYPKAVSALGAGVFSTSTARAVPNSDPTTTGVLLTAGEVQRLTDDQLLLKAGEAEREGRRVDASRVALAAEIAHRSRKDLGSESLSAKKGCRSAGELIERVTLVSSATAGRRIRLGTDLRPRASLSGADAPAMFPAVAEALSTGALSVDAATVITDRLRGTVKTAGVTDMQKAEAGLVQAATGQGPDSPVPCTADDIRRQAEVLQTFLDQDGTAPTEERSMANRGFGKAALNSHGLMTGHYALMPEVYARLERLFDSYVAASSAPVFMSQEELAAKDLQNDPRSWQQQRHDIFASAIDTMSRSGIPPVIGGAAPTVLISVRAEDLHTGHGPGWIDGLDVPVSMRAVKQFTCSGGTQRVVIDEYGAVIELGSPQRVFTANQRKAIMLRDGGCIIPGCNIPAGWTEIHHVVPDSVGGPTHISNGVAICWWHHATIESSGWQIRMVRGSPEIKAPPWLETDSSWRPATKSRTTLTNRIQYPPA